MVKLEENLVGGSTHDRILIRVNNGPATLGRLLSIIRAWYLEFHIADYQYEHDEILDVYIISVTVSKLHSKEICNILEQTV